MNDTMLSQIAWVMFFTHHFLPKVAKICQKKTKVYFRVNHNMGSDDSGTKDAGTISLQGGPVQIFMF